MPHKNEIKKSRFAVLAIVLVVVLGAAAHVAWAATNISSSATEHWAWNDIIGWINFYETDTVVVNSFKIAGYASSSSGDISLDCATTRGGNICITSDYRVINDGNGNLSGWGWNDVYGWISFCGGSETADCPGTVGYRVLIDPNTGIFTNYAWNDVAGWISFNCVDPGICGSSNYKVVTTWTATSTSGFLDSSTFDTGVASGTQLNSVLWQGSLPFGTSVRFQFATATSTSGPWNYVGPDGTANTFYSDSPNASISLAHEVYAPRRYFRYRVTLISDQAQRLSPRIDDVIVNWSP